ncbi:hypothetical protein ACIQM0_38555 [Streptomyces sp. NPDC091387]|uniref:hypothetical protein n=1 Tax=Streptomyces sp. NPDC091387 TaxID=3365998 RepID=UPI0038166B1B
MPEEITPQPLSGPVLELAKVRAALAAGLTVEQAVRLQGADEAALTADALSFAAEISAANPAPQGPRSGGARGPDVQGSGTVGHGAERYRQRAGLDADGKRPPVPQRTGDGRNPYAEPSYTWSNR